MSINQLCSLMSISRARYYQILAEGLLHPPLYSDSNRPYFTRELALENIAVKKNNIGINGKICIFYNCSPSILRQKITTKRKNIRAKLLTKTLILLKDFLALVLMEFLTLKYEAALKKCFPNGVGNVEEGEILRQVYCLIKEQNSNDNVNG